MRSKPAESETIAPTPARSDPGLADGAVAPDNVVPLKSAQATRSPEFIIASRNSGISRLLSHGGFQLGFGLLAAVVIPQILRVGLDPAVRHLQASQINSVIATALAVCIGYLLYRRLTRHPSISALSYLAPAMAIAFLTALAVIFFARLDYSRFMFAASFGLALVWFHGLHLLAGNHRKRRFAVLPVGKVGDFADLTRAEWHVVEEPPAKPRAFDGIVLDLRAEIPAKWQAFLTKSALAGVPVYHYRTLAEELSGRVDISHLSENRFGTLLPDGYYLRLKQIIDLIAALILLPFVILLSALIAIWIRIDSPGPALYFQRRIGVGGEPFTLWKFRTMKTGVNGDLSEAQLATTLVRDDRITRCGRILRRMRLDELPQIVNILRGDMSWIGPRPDAVPLARMYSEQLPFYSYRHIVRPGITGWAQVAQGHVTSIDEVAEKLHYDFYYIKNLSIWLDMLIALRTIRIILTGAGAK